jgi:hypothetical protein
MDALAAAQIQLVKQLQLLKNQYKERAETRKNLKLVKSKIITLKNMWSEFQQNDDVIRFDYSED